MKTRKKNIERSDARIFETNGNLFESINSFKLLKRIRTEYNEEKENALFWINKLKSGELFKNVINSIDDVIEIFRHISKTDTNWFIKNYLSDIEQLFKNHDSEISYSLFYNELEYEDLTFVLSKSSTFKKMFISGSIPIFLHHNKKVLAIDKIDLLKKYESQIANTDANVLTKIISNITYNNADGDIKDIYSDYQNQLLNKYQDKIREANLVNLYQLIISNYEKNLKIYDNDIKIKILNQDDLIFLNLKNQDKAFEYFISNFYEELYKHNKVYDFILKAFLVNKFKFNDKEFKDFIQKYPGFINENNLNLVIKKLINYQAFTSLEFLSEIYIIENIDYSFIQNINHIPGTNPHLLNFEKNLRNNIKSNEKNNLIKSNDITSIDYIKTLEYLKKNEDSLLYNETFKIFEQYLLNNFEIEIPDEIDKRYINNLFYKFVNGFPLSNILKFYNINEVIMYHKFHEIFVYTEDFTKDQLAFCNSKHLLEIRNLFIDKFMNNYDNEKKILINTLIMKCYLVFGYDYSKKILSEIVDLSQLEWYFSSCNVANIKINDDKSFETYKKFVAMFINHNHNLFKDMHLKNREIYSFFPDLYNNFNDIFKKFNVRDISLPKMLNYLKIILSDNYSLLPNEYKLIDEFMYINTSDEARKNWSWYQLMKQRYHSTIPKVKGEYNNYSYEILDLDDPLHLSVGKRTHCCFLLNGLSKTALHHAMTSNNGRVIVIKFDNQIIAQSWIWRKGSLLCFDNIEVIDKKNVSPDFFLCYIEVTKKLWKIINENEYNKLTHITLGRNSADIEIPYLDNLPKYVKKSKNANNENISNNVYLNELPILDEKIYSDAKDCQVILMGNCNKLPLDEDIIKPVYYEKRTMINCIDVSKIETSEKYKISSIINSVKYDSGETNLDRLVASQFKILYYQKDWYAAVKYDNKIEANCISIDPRAIDEYEKVLKKLRLLEIESSNQKQYKLKKY